MYYGGDALSQGRSSADASSYVTAAQQIAGAAVMHINTQPAVPTTVADLVASNNLSGVPNVKSRVEGKNEWTMGSVGVPVSPRTISMRMLTINLAGTPASNKELCEQINKKAGATGIDATD